ncbi:aminopeptidase [Fictibacillus enclensis]|uniref:aminopeptidase n=1 Tax=Fictibacillus enclensis TaxID=1017270 RepID=UPI0025A0A973|nr:aminopeptidase [Fictibacillus enclensis]MDM5335848.1 aminopeptidase [Fictibacillus enclensis]
MSNWDNFINTIIHQSLTLNAGETVYVDIVGEVSQEFTDRLATAILKIKATPIFHFSPITLLKTQLIHGDAQFFDNLIQNELPLLKQVDAYMSIRADQNIYELQDVPAQKQELYTKHYALPKQMEIMEKKWLILKYPTEALAQLAHLSIDQFKRAFFKASSVNFKPLEPGIKSLQKRLATTKNVRVLSPHTDLTFSIHNMPSFVCTGTYNLPDGEIFTAPLLYSANGCITFNVPSSLLGTTYEHVKLQFENGRIVKATCSQQEQFNLLLQTDNGASYLGEFGIGFNPEILHPFGNPLFDEKMAGSIHLAIGQPYEMSDNGNKSNIHLDLILCQIEEYGGGELYFDDELIRKNGYFVPDHLHSLNPAKEG